MHPGPPLPWTTSPPGILYSTEGAAFAAHLLQFPCSSVFLPSHYFQAVSNTEWLMLIYGPAGAGGCQPLPVIYSAHPSSHGARCRLVHWSRGQVSHTKQQRPQDHLQPSLFFSSTKSPRSTLQAHALFVCQGEGGRCLGSGEDSLARAQHWIGVSEILMQFLALLHDLAWVSVVPQFSQL